SVTVPAKVGSTFPLASSAVTARLNGAPAATGEGVGWPVTTSCVAVAFATLSAGESPVSCSWGRPEAVSTKPGPARVSVRVLNVATPLTAVCVRVPPSVVPLAPVPVLMETVTRPLYVGSTFPLASTAATTAANVALTPTAPGRVVNLNWVAVAGAAVERGGGTGARAPRLGGVAAGPGAVAGGDVGQGQPGEGRDAIDGRQGQRAAQGRAAGVGDQAHGDIAGEGRVDLPAGVLGRNRQSEAEVRDGIARRSGDHEL